jgi:hypothetical protein
VLARAATASTDNLPRLWYGVPVLVLLRAAGEIVSAIKDATAIFVYDGAAIK